MFPGRSGLISCGTSSESSTGNLDHVVLLVGYN